MLLQFSDLHALSEIYICKGFWEQNGILDQEIGLFVASRWEQLKDKDGESFYYNQVRIFRYYFVVIED